MGKHFVKFQSSKARFLSVKMRIKIKNNSELQVQLMQMLQSCYAVDSVLQFRLEFLALIQQLDYGLMKWFFT